MSETTLNVDIITPQGTFYAGEVYLTTMPGIDGEIGVMLGHAPTVIGLSCGLITMYDNNMKILKKIFIDIGFVQVNADKATILVQEAAYLESYNLKDSMKRLEDLNIDLGFCKEEAQKSAVTKEIQMVESLIQILKR